MARALKAVPMLVVLCALLLLVLKIAELQLLVLLWVPLAMVAFLLALPPFAMTGGKSLLKGLFDLDLSPRGLPIRMFTVTLTVFCVAGTASRTAALALLHGPARLGLHGNSPRWLQVWASAGDGQTSWRAEAVAIAIPVALVGYFAAFAVYVSWNQASKKHPRSLVKLSAGALLALVAGGFLAWLVIHRGPGLGMRAAALKPHWPWLQQAVRRWGQGYNDGAWHDHLTALAACMLTGVLYALLGIYGKRKLGKLPTVPALASALMIVLVLGWLGSAAEFFLSRWHLSLLLLLPALAVVNSFLPHADHVYPLVKRSPIAAASPAQVLNAHGGDCAILVAAAGGGIQAAAWTAQVLEGLLHDHGPRFNDALRLISGISGGSMGAACFVNWLASGGTVRPPSETAADSSLDEVGWGLAWPDLWRFIFPLIAFWKIDRALAMEQAWSGNAACKHASPELRQPLSDWNRRAADGSLPALVMNATVVEIGGPLLMGTTQVTPPSGQPKNLWLNGEELHRIGHEEMDVPVVRAARISASFPYVSPVARPDKANRQPHMIDGGLFDNSGMSTLTAWLDEALSTPGTVKRVLVLQINGFPASKFKIPADTRGGWLKQLIAPIEVLVNGRTAGQLSHGQIELNLLKQKWQAHGVQIEEVLFEFTFEEQPPLSWHLMPRQRESVGEQWQDATCIDLVKAKAQVAQFLAGTAPHTS